MKTINLLLVVNSASHAHASGVTHRYYVDGKRVTMSRYVLLDCYSTRQDSFITKIKGHVTRHYKTVYIA